MRSEATAAAEHKVRILHSISERGRKHNLTFTHIVFQGKIIMHDPFAMRPFFGYNFGHYLSHWLSMETKSQNLPKIFHVNWFRKDEQGKFLWPGFGENSRVLDWILRRIDNEDCAKESPIGLIPKDDALNLKGLSQKIDMDRIFEIPKEFWLQEVS